MPHHQALTLLSACSSPHHSGGTGHSPPLLLLLLRPHGRCCCRPLPQPRMLTVAAAAGIASAPRPKSCHQRTHLHKCTHRGGRGGLRALVMPSAQPLPRSAKFGDVLPSTNPAAHTHAGRWALTIPPTHDPHGPHGEGHHLELPVMFCHQRVSPHQTQREISGFVGPSRKEPPQPPLNAETGGQLVRKPSSTHIRQGSAPGASFRLLNYRHCSATTLARWLEACSSE